MLSSAIPLILIYYLELTGFFINVQLIMDADTDILSRHHGLGENDIASEVNETLDSTMTSVGPDVSQESVGEFNSDIMVNPLTDEVEQLSDVHVENNGSLTPEVHCFNRGCFDKYC